MSYVTLGRTGIKAHKNGFGALPIQRVSMEEAATLLRKAYQAGITYFDTARNYTDSEEKIGHALADVRDRIFIATKTGAVTTEDFWAHLETSLKLLRTDYIDVYQFHNPSFCPKPDDGTGLYEAMLEAKRQGRIRFIGLTNHREKVAREAVESGLYDLLQFPFSYLADSLDIALAETCREHNVGFVAMKGLSGGLLTNSAAAYAWLEQYPQVLPIWGVQREHELDEFISYMSQPPLLDEELQRIIDHDRQDLMGDFCRACAYCMPCPVGIQINTCARMSQLIRRSPSARHLSEEGQAMMRKVEECIHCNQCAAKCPYQLDTPALLQKNYQDYKEILAGKPI